MDCPFSYSSVTYVRLRARCRRQGMRVFGFGFRMAASPADPEHPFGHGRVEYLSGLFLAVVII